MESAAFRSSSALIIDVRNNDGGRRDFLEYLLPYFIDEPLVHDIAVARVDTIELLGRGLRSPSDSSLPEPARAAIQAALAKFSPHWDYRVDEYLPEVRAAVLMPVAPPSRMSDPPGGGAHG